MNIKRKIEDMSIENSYEKTQYKKLKKISENSPSQKTKEWFEMRKNRITASNIGSCLRKNYIVCEQYIKDYNLQNFFNTNDDEYCNPYSDLDNFFLQKANMLPYTSSEATMWGNKLENACLHFYRRLTGEKVREFGLIPHETIPYLGCSPDGISVNGIMLEIKAPFKRKLKGYPPIYYWLQCQIQLEVCDLQKCDFIECEIKMIDKNEFLNKSIENSILITQSGSSITNCQSKGLLLKYASKNETNYIYPKWNMSYEKQLEWAERKIKKYSLFDITIEYYYIKSYTLNTIERKKEWFKKIEPMLESVYRKMTTMTIEQLEKIKKEKDDKEKKEKDDLVILDLEDCLL